MFRLRGECVRFTLTPWNMEGRSGVAKTARIVVGRADFVDVRVPDTMPEPRDGDVVDWIVRPGLSNGRLRIDLVENYEGSTMQAYEHTVLDVARDAALAGAGKHS